MPIVVMIGPCRLVDGAMVLPPEGTASGVLPLGDVVGERGE